MRSTLARLHQKIMNNILTDWIFQHFSVQCSSNNVFSVRNFSRFIWRSYSLHLALNDSTHGLNEPRTIRDRPIDSAFLIVNCETVVSFLALNSIWVLKLITTIYLKSENFCTFGTRHAVRFTASHICKPMIREYAPMIKFGTIVGFTDFRSVPKFRCVDCKRDE